MIEIGVGFCLAVLVLAWPRRTFEAPEPAEGTGRLRGLAARSGRVVACRADAANPAASRAADEGRGR